MCLKVHVFFCSVLYHYNDIWFGHSQKELFSSVFLSLFFKLFTQKIVYSIIHLIRQLNQDCFLFQYFYSIKDISIGGQCICYGHASVCLPRPNSDVSIQSVIPYLRELIHMYKKNKRWRNQCWSIINHEVKFCNFCVSKNSLWSHFFRSKEITKYYSLQYLDPFKICLSSKHVECKTWLKYMYLSLQSQYLSDGKKMKMTLFWC